LGNGANPPACTTQNRHPLSQKSELIPILTIRPIVHVAWMLDRLCTTRRFFISVRSFGFVAVDDHRMGLASLEILYQVL
jgi:hypothetical protein